MSATTPLRILFATPEAAPWVKTGGLGDVSAALPAALAEAGLDVRVLLPAYPALVAAFPARTVLAQVERPGGELLPATISRVQLQPRLELLLVECPAYYERHGGPYQDQEIPHRASSRKKARHSSLLIRQSGPGRCKDTDCRHFYE